MNGKVAFTLAAFLSVVVASPPLQLEKPPRFYDLKPQKGPQINDVGANSILPSSLDPQTYRVKLQPVLYNDTENNLLEWTTPGSVEIVGTAVNGISFIALNRHTNLKINRTSVLVKDKNNAEVRISSIEDPEDAQVYLIVLAQPLIVGDKYTISMDFVGVIQAGTSGLYRGYYTNDKGEEKRIAVTQFESKGARMAFPCFDEPSFNSNFTISLARRNDTGYNTLCNANQRITGEQDPVQKNWVWDHYQETVKMPTYLVAIVISDFIAEEAPAGLFHSPVKVYGVPDLMVRGAGVFSASTSAKVMTKLEEIFEVKYEMPKLDSVAVPRNYFAAGAMENWGLITYRDNYLLYYTGETIETEKQQIASVIVHEQAHQWFGNLVTCKWWSHIWLNEGFATYVAQLGFNEVYPEFEERREFLVDSVQGSMAFDIGPNQPILNLAADKDEQTSSSVIIYDKGGSIIRMMEGFLGYETLRTALVEYLKKHAYQSAEQDQLFNTMHEYVKDKIPADKTFKEIMDTWTTQPGYPLIRVNKVGANRVYISQERFLPAGQAAEDTNLWEVPITVVTAETPDATNHEPTFWLTKDTLMTSRQHDTSKWILLNPDGFGYYRVMYDDATVKLIQAELNTFESKISGLSRSQLVDDYFTFAQLGHGSITTALDMTTSFILEKDYVVWYPLFKHLTKALQMFNNRDISNLKSYLAPKVNMVLKDPSITWTQAPTEAGTKVIYRSRLVDWACALDSDDCKETAKALLTTWQATPAQNPIGLDLQPVLYCAIVAHGEGGYDFIKNLFASTTDAFQKARLLNALPCSQKNDEIRDLLELALDSNSEISKSTVSVFQRAAGNKAARRTVLDFIRDDANFAKLKSHTGGSVTFFGSIVSSLSTYLNSDSERTLLDTFIESKKDELSSIMNSLNNSLNAIKANEAWIATNFDVMNNWFAAHI